MAANEKHPKMPHVYLEKRYESRCPSNLKNALYMKHTINRWEGFLEKNAENRIVRIETKDEGKLVDKGNGLVEIVWDKWSSEHFIKANDSVYYYIPDPKKTKLFQLKHNNWSDQFVIHLESKEACRVTARHECAKIKFANKDNLR